MNCVSYLLFVLSFRLVSCIFSSPACTSPLSFSTNDLLVLQEFYNSTQGDYWDYPSGAIPWNFESPLQISPCAWYGLTCLSMNDTACFVKNMSFPEQIYLNGSLPNSLGNLVHLTSFTITANDLVVGTIPNSLFLLPNINTVSISFTSLGGHLPLEWSPSLSSIHLQSNYLSGSVSRSLCSVYNMSSFKLNNNFNLTGSIPSCIWPQLSTFDISFNHFTGTLPVTLCNSSLLSTFFIGNNHLHGTFPACLRVASSITLTNNFFTGSIPDIVFQPTSYQILLTNNLFTGTIPSSLTIVQKPYIISFENNLLNGTIDDSLCPWLPSLYGFVVFGNSLTGSLPSCNASLWDSVTHPQYYLFDANAFTGSLPAWLCARETVAVSSNFLSGNLSQCVVDAQGTTANAFVNSQSFLVSDNFLTGTLPSYSDPEFVSVYREFFCVSNNFFWGSIPASFVNIGYYTLLVDNNVLTGSLPAIASSGSTMCQLNMVYLNASSNFLTGLIPVGYICGVLDLSFNRLFGRLTFPNYILNNFGQELFLQGNQLTGNGLEVLNATGINGMVFLDLSENLLSGSIPQALFQIPSLVSLVLSVNCFAPLDPATICDMSESPTMVVNNMTTLILDGLSSACQHRILPRWFTSSQGAYSPPNAPDTVAGTTITTTTSSSSIPSCLFNAHRYPLLESLHMSGNGLTGTLPELSVSGEASVLTDLSLSHNFLTGTIPLSIQAHTEWETLDLAENKLTGVLSVVDASALSSSITALFLNNNRLSGQLPSTIKHIQNISVLTGNMFACPSGIQQKGDLPSSDPAFESYECGSDATNIVLLIWAGMGVLGLVGGLCFYRGWSPLRGCIQVYCMATDVKKATTSPLSLPYPHLHRYHTFCRAFFRWMVHVMVLFVLVGLVVFASLAVYYRTYQHTYVWFVSVGFLSGWTPAMVCLGLLMLYVVLVFTGWVDKWLVCTSFSFYSVMNALGHETETETETDDALETSESMSVSSVFTWFNWRQYGGLYLLWVSFFVVNLTVVMAVNMSYVQTETQNRDISLWEKLLLSLSMSLFKMLWGHVCDFLFRRSWVWYHPNHPVSETNEVYTSLALTWLSIFNNILSLLIANAVYNTSCFYYLFYTPPVVVSSFDAYACQNRLSVVPSYVDQSDIIDGFDIEVTSCANNVAFASTFVPFFTYSYQCSAALLTVYVPVLLFRCVTSGVLIPAFHLLGGLGLRRSVRRWGLTSCLSQGWYMCVPGLVRVSFLTPEELMILTPSSDKGDTTSSQRSQHLYHIHRDFVETMTLIAIVCVFGSLFPPLALVGGVCVLLRVGYYRQLFTWIEEKSRVKESDLSSTSSVPVSSAVVWMREHVVAVLDADVASLRRLWRPASFHVLVYFLVIMWSLFLFDTLGDTVGGQHALWVFPVAIVMPIALISGCCCCHCGERPVTHPKDTMNISAAGRNTQSVSVENPLFEMRTTSSIGVLESVL